MTGASLLQYIVRTSRQIRNCLRKIQTKRFVVTVFHVKVVYPHSKHFYSNSLANRTLVPRAFPKLKGKSPGNEVGQIACSVPQETVDTSLTRR